MFFYIIFSINASKFSFLCYSSNLLFLFPKIWFVYWVTFDDELFWVLLKAFSFATDTVRELILEECFDFKAFYSSMSVLGWEMDERFLSTMLLVREWILDWSNADMPSKLSVLPNWLFYCDIILFLYDLLAVPLSLLDLTVKLDTSFLSPNSLFNLTISPFNKSFSALCLFISS